MRQQFNQGPAIESVFFVAKIKLKQFSKCAILTEVYIAALKRNSKIND